MSFKEAHVCFLHPDWVHTPVVNNSEGGEIVNCSKCGCQLLMSVEEALVIQVCRKLDRGEKEN